MQSCVQYARFYAQLGVRLVSGDHLDTARQVALKSGIMTQQESFKKNSVMLGIDFRERIGGLVQDSNGAERIGDIAEFESIVKNLKVLARANSSDKHLLIIGLQQLGRKVAATGDGIFDSMALNTSDVGLAMGSSDYSCKQASSIILTNNDFEAAIRAVMWGRNIYHNISRFLQFQITINITALLSIFFGIIIFQEPPFSAVQLLWVNLIMDTFGALALSTEPPMRSVIKGPSFKSNAKLINGFVWRQILGIALWNFIVITFVFFFGRMLGDLPSYSNTISIAIAKPDNFDAAHPDTAGESYIQSQSKRTHLTYIFNIFVFL